MVSGDSNSTPLSVLERAEAHFPGQAQLVQRLFYGSDAFHSMCEDLAIAVETLTHIERLPETVREARRQEYAALVEALLKEMGEALAQSKIVMLRRPSDTRPKSP